MAPSPLEDESAIGSDAGSLYISLTGLKLKSRIHYPRFMWHRVRAMAQARISVGNLYAHGKVVDGVHHTLSVWTSENAMRAYLTSGAHLAAMKAFRSIATGKTCGFHATQRPDWSEVPAIWQERGREV